MCVKIHFQANIDFSLCCTFQRLVFSERREIVATDRQTDRQTDRMKHQRCRCLGGMQPFHIHSNKLTATKQYNSCAIRSQSVLTTIQLGVSIMSMHTEIASIACLHNFSGPALLSCLTYQLLGSQLWIALPLKNSKSPAAAMINRE